MDCRVISYAWDCVSRSHPWIGWNGMLGITGAALCTQCNKNVKYNILTSIMCLDLLEACFALMGSDSWDSAQRLSRFRWGSSGCELAHHRVIIDLCDAASLNIHRATCHDL